MGSPLLAYLIADRPGTFLHARMSQRLPARSLRGPRFTYRTEQASPILAR
jgi:hypothetical protein